MRICIPTADNRGLDARAHDHFGSAPFFTLVDVTTNEVTVVPNGGAEHEHGACRPLRQLRSHEFDTVICRGMGRRALANLDQQGIEVHMTPCDTVSEIVAAVGRGETQPLSTHEACQGHGAEAEPSIRRQRRRCKTRGRF